MVTLAGGACAPLLLSGQADPGLVVLAASTAASVGGNVLSDILTDGVRLLRDHPAETGTEVSQDWLEERFTQVLEAGGEPAAVLEAELVGLLNRIDAGQAAVTEAVRLGHEETARRMQESLAQVNEGFAAVTLRLEDLRITTDVINQAVERLLDRASPPARLQAGPAGWPLEEMTSPFALEVHRAIDVAGDGTGVLSELPAYVNRNHDRELTVLARAAAGGTSGIAVLVGGSSTGKTRACWQALEVLRRSPGEWRLLHPIDPSRTDAALRDLPGIGPRTVVWLNEAQEYLGGREGERIAAGLRTLLADPARAPVVILGTLWPEHYDSLTRNRTSQAGQLLDGTVIPVPAAFSGTDLARLREAAKTDPRLAHAAEHAKDGQITQYLAAAPALLERFHAAPAASKALVLAAMDARRLGARPALPAAFLEDAVAGYLPRAEWDALGEDWAEQAFAYTAVLCKGARGLLTRTGRPDRTSRIPGAVGPRPSAEPIYRLADYLDQLGRADRAAQIPPPEFWASAGTHAAPDDQAALGDAAHERGLYRDAAQLRKNASAHGSISAAYSLVTSQRWLRPGDFRPARWVADRADVTDPYSVAKLLRSVQAAGAADAAATLACRAADQADPSNPAVVARLMDCMRESGAAEQATALASRAADQADASDPVGASNLLDSMRLVGAAEQATALAGRTADQADISDPVGASNLLDSMRLASAPEQAAALARRLADADVSDPRGVSRLLFFTWLAGAAEQATVLARRAVDNVSLSDPDGVSQLLDSMRQGNAAEQAAALAHRIAENADLSDPNDMASLLRIVGQQGCTAGQITALAQRAADRVGLSNSAGLSNLLYILKEAGADEQFGELARRAADHADLSNLTGLSNLLYILKEAGADEQFAAVARRAADNADPRDLGSVTRLLDTLRRAGAGEQFAELVRRAAEQADLGGPDGAASLLDTLRRAGAGEQFAELARRAVDRADLSDPVAVARLLDTMWQGRADDQFVALARRAAHHADLSDPGGVVTLLASLEGASVSEQFAIVARRAVATAELDDSGGAASLLDTLRRTGATEQFAELARRAADHASLNDLARVGRLLYTMWQGGADEQFAALARRAANDADLSDPIGVTRLIDALRQGGADEQFSAVALHAADHTSLDNSSSVAILLNTLRRRGADTQFAVLARRAADHASLRDPGSAVDLLNIMQEAGAVDQVNALSARLAAAGMFWHFLTWTQAGASFGFGREDDGTPTVPWDWDDLD